jgi:Arc/MetJ-type ribon-helix-helix transcriptional regulator
MTIELTAEMQEIIREQLATGRFASEAEVLSSALKKLQREWEFHQDLTASMEDEASGRVKTLDEFDTEFRATHNLSSRR